MRRLRRLGVTEAWAGSLDALLHRDLGGVNARLVADCAARTAPDCLRPFGAVNPLLPDWREELRRCHEEHRMPGIRLHPELPRLRARCIPPSPSCWARPPGAG